MNHPKSTIFGWLDPACVGRWPFWLGILVSSIFLESFGPKAKYGAKWLSFTQGRSYRTRFLTPKAPQKLEMLGNAWIEDDPFHFLGGQRAGLFSGFQGPILSWLHWGYRPGTNEWSNLPLWFSFISRHWLLLTTTAWHSAKQGVPKVPSFTCPSCYPGRFLLHPQVATQLTTLLGNGYISPHIPGSLENHRIIISKVPAIGMGYVSFFGG